MFFTQSKNTLILFFLAVVQTLWGQTIEKGIFFNAHALGVCRDTSQLIKMTMDSAGNIKTYSWTRLYGRVDVVKPGEKPKTMDRVANAAVVLLDAFGLTQPEPQQPELPTVACLGVRTLSADYIKNGTAFSPNFDGATKFFKDWIKIPFDQLAHHKIYPYAQTATEGEYKFFRADNEICTKSMKFNFFDTLTLLEPKAIQKMYPELGIGDSSYTVYMTYKSDYIQKTKYQLRLDQKDLRIRNAKLSENFLQNQVNMKKLEDYKFEGSTLSLIDGTKISLMQHKGGAQSFWDPYLKFQLVRYDDNGEILAQTSFETEYIKQSGFLEFAYDTLGNPVGVLLALSPVTVLLSRKAPKDPVKDHHLLYYFDLDGELRDTFSLHYDHLSPLVVIKKDDRFEILNVYFSKLRERNEVLIINEKKEMTITPYVHSTKGMGFSDYWGYATRIDDGLFLITRAFGKDVSNATSGFVSMCILTSDFKILAAHKFYHEAAGTPVVDYLGKFDNDYKFVVTTQLQNYFISAGTKTIATKFPNESAPSSQNAIMITIGSSKDGPETKGMSMPKSMLGKNYVVDRKNRKIHAIYQHGAGNGLSYLLTVKF